MEENIEFNEVKAAFCWSQEAAVRVPLRIKKILYQYIQMCLDGRYIHSYLYYLKAKRIALTFIKNCLWTPKREWCQKVLCAPGICHLSLTTSGS